MPPDISCHTASLIKLRTGFKQDSGFPVPTGINGARARCGGQGLDSLVPQNSGGKVSHGMTDIVFYLDPEQVCYGEIIYILYKIKG
jgi:hypothetical protein